MSDEKTELSNMFAAIDAICAMQNMLKPHMGADTFLEKLMLDVYNRGANYLGSIPATFTKYLKERGQL